MTKGNAKCTRYTCTLFCSGSGFLPQPTIATAATEQVITAATTAEIHLFDFFILFSFCLFSLSFAIFRRGFPHTKKSASTHSRSVIGKSRFFQLSPIFPKVHRLVYSASPNDYIIQKIRYSVNNFSEVARLIAGNCTILPYFSLALIRIPDFCRLEQARQRE